MSFCATCGRRRTGDARFCDDCGTAFPPAEAAGNAGTPPAGQPAAGFPQDAGQFPQDAGDSPPEPADATRVERPPDATRLERRPDATGAETRDAAPLMPAASQPDPFASWFAADPPDGKTAPRNNPPGPGQQTAGPWEAADTMYAAPGQRPPAFPPPQPPYGAQQARPPGGSPPGGRPSSGGRKAAFVVVVVLVMLAAGGGAYALVSRSDQHNTAQPPAPTGAASSAASASASAAPSTSASTSPAASASPSAGLVSLAPGVASNPAEPAVEQTLTHYYQGINTHNYAEYASSLDAQERAAEPESKFSSGYSSTVDSGMKLISLTSNGSGGLTAQVTFTSRQAAGTGVDDSSCNNWTLNFYLVQQGGGYLKGAAPADYQPTYSDC